MFERRGGERPDRIHVCVCVCVYVADNAKGKNS